MKIWEIKENKKQFLSLLLLADEQENMIDRYLERGTMYVLNDNGVKAECVVTDEGNGILEIKNIATVPEYQGKGYAKSLPFFGRDEVINEILRTTPHLSASLEEIKDYYERNPDNKDRTEYIKSIFNNDYTELTLEDGRTVGYKTFENVLHLWEGKYDSRTAQSYYDWAVIARHFEAM